VLVANLTRAVLHGVSVLVIGNWLGLQFSKPDDKHVNANGGFIPDDETSTNARFCSCHRLETQVADFIGEKLGRYQKRNFQPVLVFVLELSRFRGVQSLLLKNAEILF
jgi:hypothetical protein